MAHTGNKSGSARFQVGNKVRVKYGVIVPDFPDIPLGGWTGTVTEVKQADDQITYEIKWNKRTLLTVTDFGGQSMKPRESKPPQVSAMASLDSESEGGLTERLSADEKSARSTCFPATSSNSDTDSSPLHEKRLYQRPPQNQ